MVKEGGIGDSFDKLPVVGAAPKWMSEKAIAIGMYFVASGINVVIGQPLPVEGSEYVVELLTKLFEKHFGAKLDVPSRSGGGCTSHDRYYRPQTDGLGVAASAV